MTGNTKGAKSKEMTAEQAREILREASTAKQQAVADEIDVILKKHNAEILPLVSITGIQIQSGYAIRLLPEPQQQQ